MWRSGTRRAIGERQISQQRFVPHTGVSAPERKGEQRDRDRQHRSKKDEDVFFGGIDVGMNAGNFVGLAGVKHLSLDRLGVRYSNPSGINVGIAERIYHTRQGCNPIVGHRTDSLSPFGDYQC